MKNYFKQEVQVSIGVYTLINYLALKPSDIDQI